MPPKFFNSVELTNYNAQKLYQAIHNQCLKKKQYITKVSVTCTHIPFPISFKHKLKGKIKRIYCHLCVVFPFAFLCENVLHILVRDLESLRDLESIRIFILKPTIHLCKRIRNRFRWIIINAMIPHIPF